jgi:hypothetical protein
MKFVHLMSYLLGIGLPVLETYRRGLDHFLVNTMTMAGDYIMGAMLLIAAVTYSLKKPVGPIWMIIAWGYVLGVMNAAFLGHFEGVLRGGTQCDNPPMEISAVVVKGLIWLIALGCLAVSAYSLHQQRRELFRIEIKSS